MRSRSILWSFNYAIEGVVFALRTQRNMRIHVAAAVLSLIAALVLQVGTMGLVAIVFAIALVFVTELANTALEAAVRIARTGGALELVARIADERTMDAWVRRAEAATVVELRREVEAHEQEQTR